MMKHVLALVVLFCVAIPRGAHGETNDNGAWIVASGGNQPERYVALVDENSMRRDGGSVEIQVRVLFESISRPEEFSGTFFVNCGRGTMVTRNIRAHHRGGRVEGMQDEPEREPRDLTEHQVLRFACDHGKDGRQRVYTSNKDADTTSFVFIGQDRTGLPASAYVRDVLWSNKAIENLARAKEETAGRKEALEKTKASAEYAARMIERRHDQVARAQNRRGRNSLLQASIGMSEREFVESFGVPDSYRDGPDGNRWLYYQDSLSRENVHVASNRVVGGYYLNCTIIILIFEGKVHDYSIDESGSNDDHACRMLFGLPAQ